MKQARMTVVALGSLITFLAVSWANPTTKGDNPKAALQGAWVAQSLEINGKKEPAEDFKTLRFTFKEDKLFVRGNFKDDSEDECTYQIDAKKTPAHFEFTPSKEKAAIVGIYEIKGDELKLCRNPGGKGGRPKTFATQADSGLVLVVFKKQK